MKILILALMVIGLSGAIPALADDNCELKIGVEKALQDCALKDEPVQNVYDGFEGELDNDTFKISAEEQKHVKIDPRENNDILDELIKQ